MLGRARRLGAAVFTGRWIDADTGEAAGEAWDLVVAPDVADVAPYAVTGEAGAVRDDGEPVYQSVNYPALVPLLFAADRRARRPRRRTGGRPAMTTVTGSYDDGEDVATDGDGFTAEHADILDNVRAIPDPATRRAVMALVVLLLFKGRAGR